MQNLKSEITDPKFLYLVTGGAGFIGSNIVERLVQRGERVRVLDNLSTGKRENLLIADCGSRICKSPNLTSPNLKSNEGLMYGNATRFPDHL